MSKLIDLEKIKPIDFPSVEMDGLDVVRYLNTLPTVEAVEVIRCKDCKYRKKQVCANPSAGMWVGVELRENDYCSYGERKSDG